ncbi:MAG TPA: transcriptional repressor LexA [Candidatus Ornithomonoglobus intestinigallinarum]|uniref:LexA repressor n=1 Tax=Candidatus Ornithomonoglobus intestinigallinarum TaxID=2840894 RepID=A0A9D1H2H9_9FIRM|nr:transcriptional repressor LexA [Candidatus Ornithomonoglobus intestinigallinarum]
MSRITEKDREIMDFIYKFGRRNGFPPTVREICGAVGLASTATVHSRLKKLEREGFIEHEDSKNRSLRLVNYTPEEEVADRSSERYLDVPVYGKVTAGLPITAIQDNSETFPLPMNFVGNKNIFMLKVSGESMINAAILDGDFIIVEEQPTAENGDIVVALVNDDEATVKTFYKEKGHFRLQPENDTMDPIIVDQVTVIGKVIGVFRML